MIKRWKPEIQTTTGIASNNGDWIRQEDNDLTSRGIRFRHRRKKRRRKIAWKEDLRSEARNTPGLCSTSSGHYRIDGQCRYWRWHVLKHTPFIGAHVSVSMSVFRRRISSHVLAKKGYTCRVTTVYCLPRKPCPPEEILTGGNPKLRWILFFFFPFSIPIRAIFWFGSEASIDSSSRLLFTPIFFNNLRK